MSFNSPWVDGAAGGTPLSAARLNNDEQGIQSAGGVWINVKDPDYAGGAKGDGTTDDSAAFAAVALAAKNALRTVPFGLLSDPAGSVCVEIPPGDYVITNPGALLGNEAMAQKGVGLRFRGAGKSATNLIFKPASAGAMINNDYWQSLQFQDVGIIAGTAGCTFMASSTSHSAQDYTFDAVRWQGFNYVFDLTGTNNNSEFRFFGCDDSGVEATGAFLHIGATSTVDQFLNYWFYAHKHWSTSAPLIDAAMGGSFHIFGLDASNWGSGLSSAGKLFYLRGATHSYGVCNFEAHGVRVEAKSAFAGLLYSEWPQGNVTFRNADWASQAGSYTYGDIINIVYANVDGAMYKVSDSTLAGGVNVKFATNDWVDDHAVLFEDCRWLQKASPSDVVSYDTTGNSNPGALPPVDFVRCRPQSTGNSIYGVSNVGMATWDARIGYRGQLLQALTARTLSVRDIGGLPFGASSYYFTVPVGAIITDLQVLSPAGTSAEADGGSWTLTTTEGSPTTIGTLTVSGAMSAGFNVTTSLSVPFLCSTQAKANLKLTPSAVANANTGGLLLVKGYW